MITCVYPEWLEDKEVAMHMETAKRAFKKHKAKVIVNDNRFLILDWANKDPVHGFMFHYVLDKELGTLAMYGDLWRGTANWGHSMGLGDVVKSMCNKKDFVQALERENVQVMMFFYEDAVEDLKKAKEKAIAEAEADKRAVSDIEDDFDYMAALLDEFRDNVGENRPFISLWRKYNTEVPADMVGRRISYLVYFWVLGFLMACDKAGLIKLQM